MRNFYIIFFFLLNILNIKISIEDGVYNIISVQKYTSLVYSNKALKFKRLMLGSESNNFRIKYQKFKNGSNSDYSYI